MGWLQDMCDDRILHASKWQRINLPRWHDLHDHVEVLVRESHLVGGLARCSHDCSKIRIEWIHLRHGSGKNVGKHSWDLHAEDRLHPIGTDMREVAADVLRWHKVRLYDNLVTIRQCRRRGVIAWVASSEVKLWRRRSRQCIHLDTTNSGRELINGSRNSSNGNRAGRATPGRSSRAGSSHPTSSQASRRIATCWA